MKAASLRTNDSSHKNLKKLDIYMQFLIANFHFLNYNGIFLRVIRRVLKMKIRQTLHSLVMVSAIISVGPAFADDPALDLKNLKILSDSLIKEGLKVRQRTISGTGYIKIVGNNDLADWGQPTKRVGVCLRSSTTDGLVVLIYGVRKLPNQRGYIMEKDYLSSIGECTVVTLHNGDTYYAQCAGGPSVCANETLKLTWQRVP